MQRKLGRWLALPAALALAGSLVPLACGGDDAPTLTIGEACAINSDCTTPLVCAFERCHNQCESDRDCASTERCVEAGRPNRVCQLSDESKCTYSSQCPGTEVCAVDDTCRDQCAEDRDCGAGQVCSSGTCAKQQELVNDGGLPSAPGAQPTGQPCSYNSDCQDGYVCRPDGFCGYECITRDDCPGRAACTANRCATGTQIFCVPGQEFLCACGGTDTGIHHQICNAAGTAVGECDCPDAG